MRKASATCDKVFAANPESGGCLTMYSLYGAEAEIFKGASSKKNIGLFRCPIFSGDAHGNEPCDSALRSDRSRCRTPRGLGAVVEPNARARSGREGVRAAGRIAPRREALEGRSEGRDDRGPARRRRAPHGEGFQRDARPPGSAAPRRRVRRPRLERQGRHDPRGARNARQSLPLVHGLLRRREGGARRQGRFALAPLHQGRGRPELRPGGFRPRTHAPSRKGHPPHRRGRRGRSVLLRRSRNEPQRLRRTGLAPLQPAARRRARQLPQPEL